jgi:hypothetical protein
MSGRCSPPRHRAVIDGKNPSLNTDFSGPILVRPMRSLLIAAILACVAHAASARSAVHYAGVVLRMPGGRPVAGVPVSASVDLPPAAPFPNFRRVDEVAKTRTAKDGTFSFTISPPRRGLYFTALGEVTVTEGNPSTSIVDDCSRVLRRPSPHRLNVIKVPRRFRPRTTEWFPTSTRPNRSNHAMERTSTRRPFALQMLKKSSLRATLALGGRRSSYSR